MSSSSLFSHPDVPLADHLKNVADMCEKKFMAQKTGLDTFFEQELWQKLIWIMGFCHDFGKATHFFQDYLLEEDEKVKAEMKGKRETNHALISAVIAHFILSKIVIGSKPGNDLWEIMPFLIFLAIKRHHGNVNNAIRMNNTDEKNELDIEYEYIDIQFRSIDATEFDHLLSLLEKKSDIKIKRSGFPESFSEYFKKNIYRGEKKRIKTLFKRLEYYFIFQYLFSLLVQSDKEEAIFKREFEFKRKSIKGNAVKKYIKKNFDSPETGMDIIRQSIFNDADKTVSQIDLESNKIFSLNVPTGTGKTFTSLSVALQLRERLENEKSQFPRIIYSLPFTSIIDQNYKVFEDIFAKPDSDILIKHHHLADLFFKSDGHEFDTDESRFLIESWESEVVVTTMFQLFHTFLTNRNRMLIKFEKLVNAIVLCDEIQSLPYKYWKMARKIMACLSKVFNTYFILITATQPKIFNKREILELVPEKQIYFSKLDRVNITFEKQPMPLGDYISLCKKEIQSNNESFLFVMNTVNSALELFECISDTDCQAEMFFLATNIVPADRLAAIREIQSLKNRKIIVSTQMIEAGVDIDIDNVWRDMGPLESINQVCGRCNRNFKQEKGNVRIFQILNESHNNTPYEKYIYGKNPLSISQTRKIIADNETVSETDFLSNMDQYYTQIEQRLSSDVAMDILNFMENLQFLSVFNKFKLIDEENYDRKDIFIELNEAAQETWKNYLETRQIENRMDRKIKFLKIKKDFYDYVISVPANFVVEKEYDDTNFVYIGKAMLPVCYDKKTGWMRKSKEVYTF
ncbi:MAG: CRISPR-associated helicase Cas3' [Desulfobacula sp.]|nr:CRISPR-associated helicase Cas3' [Desulfobacula sp.]